MLFFAVSLRGEANLLSCTGTDRQPGGEWPSSQERPRAAFITKAADGLLAKKHVSRFSLGSQSQWEGDKESCGGTALPRYAGLSPRMADNSTAVWAHKRGRGETEMADFIKKGRL